MGPIRDRVEEYIRGPHRVFAAGDGDMDKEATGWNLVTERDQEHVEGNGDVEHKDIH